MPHTMRAGIAALPDGTYRFADTYDRPELRPPARCFGADHDREMRPARRKGARLHLQ